MIKSAIISECERFRYLLTREWDDHLPAICWCLLNPSTADAMKDDPTVRRCIDFSKRWGYGRLYLVNLFAYRTTYPKELKRTIDPIGPNNDVYIGEALDRCGIVVAAWGAHSDFSTRREAVGNRLPSAFCLGKTKSGAPRHPLYVRADQSLEPFFGG